MNNADYQRTMDAFARVGAEWDRCPEKFFQFMVRAGILTPEGELSEQYKPQPVPQNA